MSLIELLVTLTVVALIAVTGVASFQSYFSHAKHEVVIQQWLSDIHFAQSEARAKHVAIGLSPKGQWVDGRVIFVDDAEDGVIHANSQILSSTSDQIKRGRIFWRSFPVYLHYLQFQPTGLMQSNNATFWFCESQYDKPAWAMMLSKSGNIRVVYPDRRGAIIDAQGKSLLCNG